MEEAENLCRNIAIIDQGNIVENTDMKSLLNRLDKEVFILDLEEPLTTELKLDNIHIAKIGSATLEVEIKKEQALNELFTTLSEQGITVTSMKNKANRLEELFLSLVDKTEAV